MRFSSRQVYFGGGGRVLVSALALAVTWLGVVRPVGARGAARSETAAQEDTANAVRRAMSAGIEAYRRGDLEEARQHFSRAWELRPFKGVAVSLAEVEMQLGQYLAAARRWQFVLAEVDDGEQRAAAEERLAECLEHLASIRLEISEPGARVIAGEQLIEDASETEVILVLPGTIVLQVERAGFLSEQRRLVLSKGEAVELTVRLVPEPPASTMEPRPVPPLAPMEPALSSRTVVLLGGGTVTLAALVMGTVHGLNGVDHDRQADAWRERTDFEGDPEAVAFHGQCDRSRTDRPASCDELSASMARARRAYDMANIAFVTAGVAGAATLAVWILWPESSPSSSDGGDRGGLSVQPWTSSAAHGLQLSGSF